MNYRNQETDEVVSKFSYQKLPLSERVKYRQSTFAPTHEVEVKEDDNGGFLTSLVVAEVTGSALAGYAVGGDVLGAEIGSMIGDGSNDTPASSNDSNDFSGYGDGDFGGGGSSGSLDD